ncbi:MAG TPA: GIDE domain-containing protein [Steroidobacteraceae bacterium]|nr:GIDE domain-containing protein [Steroidobacteraceae bacterium]
MTPQGIVPGFLLLAAFLAAGTVYSVYRLFISLRRDRFAADTPIARIRSAAQGYVHLEGEAGPPPEGPITAPLSGLPCVWWDYKIERYQRTTTSNRNTWHVIDRATSVAPFSLHDRDGECLVGPVGADVTPTSHETWYGDTPRPACLPGVEGRAWNPDREYRYTERVICAGAHLTVLGELRSRSVVESIEREVGKVVVGWKEDQATLLARFDSNHDGRVDGEEWEEARAAARQQVEGSLASKDQRVSVVGQTTHGEPFLIAPLDTKNLVSREKHRAAMALAASVVLALLTAWAAQKAMLR